MTEELHKRINENERQIGELTATVGSLAESVGRLHEDFQKGISGVYQKIDSFNERMFTYGRPNWGVVLMGIAALAAFIVLHTQPIKEQSEKNNVLLMERLKQLPDDYYQFGNNSAKVEHLETHAQHSGESIIQLRAELKAVQQHVSDLEVWLEAVDKGGSRKWIGENDNPE